MSLEAQGEVYDMTENIVTVGGDMPALTMEWVSNVERSLFALEARLKVLAAMVETPPEVSDTFNESRFSALFAGLDAHMERIAALEARLEVLAAMVETPPPLGECVTKGQFVDVTNRMAGDFEHMRDLIEALELRQDLVESPVMLRIADAAERQATALETKPADTDEMWELLRGLEEEYRQHSNVFPQVMKMVDYVREHR
jgi:hypothetical protein